MSNSNNLNLKNAPKNKFGFFFFTAMMIILVVYLLFGKTTGNYLDITYSSFISAVEQNQVSEVVVVDQREIRGMIRLGNGDLSYFKTIIPYDDTALMPLLSEKNIPVSGAVSSPGFLNILVSILPWLLTFLFILFIFRQNAMQNSRGMQFGKSKARIYDNTKKKLTFADVAGQEEAKTELAEIVDFLKSPQKFFTMGAKIPRGVLLVGSPGTGKTLLARAVAGEAGVSFLHISGSDFVEMFVGVGASRVRDLFEQGRKIAPCIIFIDELVAVGRARGAGLGGGHDEREQTLNQMLVEMDGFESKEGVIVLAATNRPDVLDPALLRPGRFDRQVHVSLPDIKEREAILKVHAKKIKISKEVDLSKYARATSGMSGADLANMINEAALYAARKAVSEVSDIEFEEARDKILMGLARKSMVLPEKERVMTAYHEAGHALPYYFVKNSHPLHKVTIIPRGRALGLTMGIPKEDSYAHTKSWIMDQLIILFGGWAAEMVVYGETTTGTQNDIQRATELAHKMVCEWGMSDEIGPVSYGQDEEPIFMGKEIARHKGYSEYTAHQIDSAVKNILEKAKNSAIDILTKQRDMLEKLSNALVEHETLTDSDIRTLLNLQEAAIESTAI
jgi:cell division protease FtsH